MKNLSNSYLGVGAIAMGVALTILDKKLELGLAEVVQAILWGGLGLLGFGLRNALGRIGADDDHRS